ncbi:hypothetical protein BJY00DRAFT_319061 [Aspergillus carlsbadensis]|nr:hypothetical protein BJY00DRAFT_319061 [Aspergillus carlsbadensis]
MPWHKLPTELRSFIFSHLTDLDAQWPRSGFELFRPINSNADYAMHERVKAARKKMWQQVRNYRLVCKQWDADYRAALPKVNTSPKPAQQTLDNLLIYAANRLFVRCMKLLLEHGANASSEIPEARIGLLAHAINKKSDKGDEASKLLISYNASTAISPYWRGQDDEESNNPLALALLRSRTEVARSTPQSWLCAESDRDEGTLHLAKYGKVDMLKLFLKHGLVVRNRDYCGFGEWPAIARHRWWHGDPFNRPPKIPAREHPLELAIKEKNAEIVQLLLEAGARFDNMDSAIEKIKDKEMKDLLQNWLQALEALAIESEGDI